MWWMMGEGGGHYSSKKTDDYCADVCGQVCPFFSGLLYRFGSFVFLGMCNRFDCSDNVAPMGL